jgi:hypothetical protein
MKDEPNLIKAAEADDLAFYLYQILASDIPKNYTEARSRVRAKLRTGARAWVEGVPVLEVDDWIERTGSLWNKENEINGSILWLKKLGG